MLLELCRAWMECLTSTKQGKGFGWTRSVKRWRNALRDGISLIRALPTRLETRRLVAINGSWNRMAYV
jgi:hypothetical protein